MLSAIVVNKHKVATGNMEPETLKGFLAAARDLGYLITDEQASLREQQSRVFEWASSRRTDRFLNHEEIALFTAS